MTPTERPAGARARGLGRGGPVAWALALSLVVPFGACDGEAGPSLPTPDPEAVARGAALYADLCAFCHGEAGEGYVSDGANALAHPAFLATRLDPAWLSRLYRPFAAREDWLSPEKNLAVRDIME